MIKQGSTLFLRCVVFILGLMALALYVFVVPEIAREAALFAAQLGITRYPTIVCLYATAIPFFIALYQTLLLLSYIDTGKAFSDLSVKALSTIKRCAVSVTVLLCTTLFLIYCIADAEDAPGLMLIGLIFTFAPLVIATFAAVLQRLLKEAIEMKKENDLTV